MNRKINHEVNFMDQEIITPRQGLRNTLFKPWFKDNDGWGIEIIEGFYSGLVLQFKEVEFVDDSDGNVSLDYHVIFKPDIVSEDDLKSSEFQNLLSDILEDILKEAIASHETGNNNSEKLGS